MTIHAEVSLAGPNAATLGQERIRLLEAVGREGSISAAARAVGVSYRSAWNAVVAMNALVGLPLVDGRSGGRRGGGARLTPAGLALVESFRRLQAATERAFSAVAPELARAAPPASVLVRTSARNALRGRVLAVTSGSVNAEVELEVAPRVTLAASLTSRSLRDLGLFPGRGAVALIKAPLVGLAAPRAAGLPAPNRLEATVASLERGETRTEVILTIGGGAELCAILAHAPGAPPALAPGRPVRAVIDPAHIILAVE